MMNGQARAKVSGSHLRLRIEIGLCRNPLLQHELSAVNSFYVDLQEYSEKGTLVVMLLGIM